MRRGARHLAAIAAVALVALLGSSAALAAGPQQIYADFADNGRLDATYAASDLRAAAQSATLGGYEDAGTVGRMRTEIRRQLGGGAPAGAQASLRATGSGGTLPFTGFDLALIVGGALFLLALGGGLRRMSRARL
jgi:opacity protein-like surface antigen